MLPEHLYTSYFPTGSNYICDPPVTDTDIDYMYFVYSIEECTDWLEENGWKKCGSNGYKQLGWISYRKGKYNLILTDDMDHYNKFEAATELAKKRNLTRKEDRIALFQTIIGVTIPKYNPALELVNFINTAPPNLDLGLVGDEVTTNGANPQKLKIPNVKPKFTTFIADDVVAHKLTADTINAYITKMD